MAKKAICGLLNGHMAIIEPFYTLAKLAKTAHRHPLGRTGHVEKLMHMCSVSWSGPMLRQT